MVARNEDLIKTLQVMVVDDDPVFRHYLEAQLAMLGCQILPMDDAESAWDRIRTQPPDLVLSDVLMPGTSGVELCRRIKSTPGLEDLPVVLLTMTGSRSKDEGYRAGADDFLSKPPHLMELRTRLRNLLLLRSLQTASAPPPPEVAESIPAARTPRLVVLESQGILREYVRGTLAEEGLEVLGVDSVARFHELLGQSLPDLAILDQDLMEGTGSALVASLRARVATADLPVLLMCNPGDLDPGGGAWNADADEH
ncbi:MAG TPA: response regulator, partial [Holophaga sp.]|nr:response regulator [Holophaga sp.]